MHTCAHHCVIEQTRAAEEVAPDGFKVHYDFNHNRTETDTLRIIDEVERSSVVGILEDPIRWQNIDGWRRLRERTSLPLLMHVPQLGGGAEILNGCADLYMVGEIGIGTSFRRGFAAATAELSTVIQLTGGAFKSPAMHLGAVLPNVSHSVNLDDQYAEDATGGRLEIDEGSTPVPEGPGLGIDVDEEKLAELEARPKSELPTHVGVLELPGGSTYYTPLFPLQDVSAASQKATSAAFAAACGTTMDQRISRPPSNESRAKGHSRHSPLGRTRSAWTGALPNQNKVDQQASIGQISRLLQTLLISAQRRYIAIVGPTVIATGNIHGQGGRQCRQEHSR